MPEPDLVPYGAEALYRSLFLPFNALITNMHLVFLETLSDAGDRLIWPAKYLRV